MNTNKCQCGALLTGRETFCRACGTLTGVGGCEPTLILARPGPNDASPWAKIGTGGDYAGPKSFVSTDTAAPSAKLSPLPLEVQTTATPGYGLAAPSPAERPQIGDAAADAFARTRVVARSASSRPNPRGWLVALTGPRAGQDWRLQPGKNTLGRGADTDIALEENSVSSLHAQIWVQEDDKVVLVDKDSTNGTFVNEIQIFQPTSLHQGDLVRLGEVVKLQWVEFQPKQ